MQMPLSEDIIRRLNETPMEQLRFRDFAHLKSGHDAYSRMSLATLREGVSLADREILDALGDDAIKGYRWLARGLDAERAVRKVKTDREISGAYRSGR